MLYQDAMTVRKWQVLKSTQQSRVSKNIEEERREEEEEEEETNGRERQMETTSAGVQ